MQTTTGSGRATHALQRVAATLLLVQSVSRAAHADPTVASSPNAEPAHESAVRGDARIVGFAAAPFGGNSSGTALGFGVGVNLGLQRIPVTIGFDVMTAFWGSQTSRMLVRTGDTLVPVDRTRDDHGYFLSASLRAQPIDWFVRPYLEGFVGSKLLATSYSLSFPQTGTSTSTETDRDWAGSLGWGAGVDIGKTRTASINLTLGFRRSTGGEASYSRTVSTNENAVVSYTTPTSFMIYMLGVSGCFGVARSTNEASP